MTKGETMKEYIIIAGINGTGKSSMRGLMEGMGQNLGYIIDADEIAKDCGFNPIKAGKMAVSKIEFCLENNLTFTQETTLSGVRTVRTVRRARQQGYNIIMYYVGLNTVEESLERIKNRVRKGGHDIPEADVLRRYGKRTESLRSIIPLCDKILFFDNTNGFIKAAEITNHKFLYTNGIRPPWLEEIRSALGL